MENELLAWALGERDLGDHVLEVGPGPGLGTDVLRDKVPRLTAVEVDSGLALRLSRRLAGTNVEVVQADATNLPFRSARFSAAACFTMLHHIRSPALQDRLMAELHRLIRPGGIVVGTDSTETPVRRELHLGDVFTPIEPAGWAERMAAVGFVAVCVEQLEDRFRFAAEVPA